MGIIYATRPSGGPISDDARSSSSEVIWWQGKSKILIDAGSGAFLRFGQSGAKMEDVDFFGITHLHTDHVSDLPAMLYNGFFFDRSTPIPMVGPTGAGEYPDFTDFMHGLFNAETGPFKHLSGVLDGDGGLFKVNLSDVDISNQQPVKVYEQDGITIWAKSIPHGDCPCLAFRIETDKGVIVVSADQNGSDESFIEFAKNADILVMPMAIDESADGQSSFMHAKSSVVGEIAAKANPKMLVLNHWMGKGLYLKDEALKIIKQYYHGPVYAGRDLQSFAVSMVEENKNEK